MAEQLEVTLTLNDQLSVGLSNASKAIDKFHDDFKRIGKEISSVGQNLTFFGAGILAPFVVAMKKASETNSELSRSFKQIETVSNQFYQSISKSLIPVIQSFTGLLVTLLGWWNGLSQSTRDFVIQATFLTGAFLSISGIITIIIGKIVSLAAGIAGAISAFSGWAAINIPLLATLAAIVTLITLMAKFQGVANTVMSTFEVLFRFLMNGFHTVNAAIGGMVSAVLGGLANIVDGLGKIPGPTQEAFQKMAESIRNAANTAHSFANLELNEVAINTQKISDIFSTGEGDWSRAFQNTKDRISEMIQNLGQLQIRGQQAATTVAVTWQQKWDSIKSVTSNFSSALSQMAAQNKKFAIAAKAVAISQAIINGAEGATQIQAKWAAYPPVAAVLHAINAATVGLQIATISAQSFAVGTPNVPADMTAQIHKGETIVPATFADAIRRGELTLGGRGSGSVGGGDVNINIYGVTFNGKEDIRQFSEELGFEVERKLRGARSLA